MSQTKDIEARIKFIYEQIGRLEMDKRRLYDELNEVMDIKATIHNCSSTGFIYATKNNLFNNIK